MWPGFKSRRCRNMWVEFVVGSLPCSERFFSGCPGFPLSSKTNISNFQFDQESGRRRTTMWMCYLQIVIYLFILLSRTFNVLTCLKFTRVNNGQRHWMNGRRKRVQLLRIDDFPYIASIIFRRLKFTWQSNPSLRNQPEQIVKLVGPWWGSVIRLCREFFLLSRLLLRPSIPL